MDTKTRNWHAWIDMMPPKPGKFIVTGEVYASNPGVQAQLRTKVPQGINPNILLLDLSTIQQPGTWPQVMTWVEARYDTTLSQNGPKYTGVEIFSEGKSIAQVNVDVVR